MEKKKNYIIGFLSGVCMTLLMILTTSLTPVKSNTNSLNEMRNVEVSLSNSDLNLISKMIGESSCDQDEIIERILYCIDGSRIKETGSGLRISTYCNR